MHLLFTDPATSPRTELGRIVYGVLYGLTTCLLYSVLLRAGMPGFWDKLLQVPLLNLSAGLLDRLARSSLLQRIDPAAWRATGAPSAPEDAGGQPRGDARLRRDGVTWRTSACGRSPSGP